MSTIYEDVNEMENEICKVKICSEEDFQNLVKVLPIEQMNIVLKNEIQRISDWLSKTYFHLKLYLINADLLNYNNSDFETLKNQIVFISETLNKFHLINSFQKAMKSDNVVMENNKFDKWTIQFVSSKLARCLLCKSSFIENLGDHIDGEQHQKNLKDPFQLKVLKSFHDGWCNVSIGLRLINQVYFLPYSETQIECCICEKYVNCQELMAHLETHRELSYPRLIHWCDFCKIPYSDDELTSHLTDRKHELNVYEYNLKQLKPPEYVHCDICDIVLQKNEFKKHVKQDYHATNLEYYGIKSLRNDSEDDPPEQSLNENLVHCDMCDIVLFRIEFQEHMRSSYHRNSWKNHDKLSKRTKIEDNQIQCAVCRVIVLREEFQAHVVGLCHQEHLKLFKDEKIENKQDEAAALPEFVSNVYKFPLIPSTGLKERDDSKEAEMAMKMTILCHVCNIPFITNDLEQHIMTEEHKTVLKQLNNLIKKEPKVAEKYLDNSWNCDFCKITVTFEKLQAHIYGPDHTRNLLEFKIKQLNKDSKSANENTSSFMTNVVDEKYDHN